MSTPRVHFWQVGHSIASIDPPYLPGNLRPLHTGPAIAGTEGGVEVIHPFEVLDSVARLLGEESGIDQREHDRTEVLGAPHAPVLQHRGREQAELLQSEVATGPGELGPRQVAARGETALRILEGGEHEQIGALVEAAVARPDLLQRVDEGAVIAHGRTPAAIRGLRAAPRVPRRAAGSSSAASST